MSHPGSVVRRRVLLTIKATAAGVLIWFGGTLAVGSYLAMRWALHPWSGAPERALVGTMFALLGVVSIVVPVLAWWFLLPRVRWLGAVLTVVWVLAFAFLVMGLS